MFAFLAVRPDESIALVVQVSFALVMGGVCAAIASGRGRSGIGWFFVGLLFSCIGLVVLLALPDLQKEAMRDRQQEQENRRLREQIAKNRQVADQRHTGLERRLGAHDQALGVDTSEPAALTGGAPPPLPDGAEWYYARNNERQGPVPTETLRGLLRDRALARTTLVWRDGMADWLAADKVPEFEGDLA